MSEKFDPMTGKPVSEPEMKFDPMTGEPIEQGVVSEETKAPEEIKAPEETKVPEEIKAPEEVETPTETAQGANVSTAEPEMNFDPMTGRPIGQGTEQKEPEMNFDPMTGRPIGQEPIAGKKFTKKTGILIGGAVAVIAIVVVAGITSGAFLSKGNKILKATKNTLEDTPRFVQDINVSDILCSNEYTIGVKADVEGDGVEGEVRSKGMDKQVSAIVSMSGMSDIEFLAELDDKQISASIPMLTDDILVYNYKEEKDGYIVDILGENGVEELDSALSEATSKKDQDEFAKKILSVIYKEYKSLDIRNAEKEEFEIDGKDRKCKGYEFTITEDNVLNILEGIEDAYDEYYEDAEDVFDVDMDDVFDEIRAEARNMDDVDVRVYVYKNKLAAIAMEMDGDELQLLFKGGDTRMQNMELVAISGRDEYSLMELDGKTKGSKEIYELSGDDSDLTMTFEYDYKSGDFSFEYEDYWDELYVGGNVQSNRSGVVVTVDELEEYGEYLDMELEVSISKGAKFEKLKGDTLDIGNASESELRDLMMGMQDYL